MADFVATIKVNIEDAAQEGGSGGGGGGKPPGIDLTGFVKTLQELRSEFGVLSAEVRGVVQALQQIKNARGASGSTGAPSVVSGSGTQSPGLAESVAEFKKVTGAAEEAAAASKAASAASEKQTGSTTEATRAATEQSTAEQLLAEMHKKAAAAMGESAAAAKEAAEQELALARARRLIEGGQPRRDPIDDKLSRRAAIQEIARPAAQLPDVAKRAAQTLEDLANQIKIPKGASSEVQKAAEKFKEEMVTILRRAVKEIDIGNVSGTKINQVGSNLQTQINVAKEQLGSTNVPQVDIQDVKATLSSRALVTALDRATDAELELIAAIQRGDDNGTIAQKAAQVRGEESRTISILRGVAKAFDTNRRTGRPGIEGGAGVFQQLRSEGLAPTRSPSLTGDAKKAFDSFNTGVKSVNQPIATARKVLDDLVNSGAGLEGLERKLRSLNDTLEAFTSSQGNFVNAQGDPDREQFITARATAAALRKVKIGPQGQIEGPAGTVSRDTSVINAQRIIQEARQQTAAAGPQAEERRISVPITDASGNVKKIDVALKAFGKTVDSVRVKTTDLSRNTFDRTSVKAALQRVAVWGAAASIVFGAFTALRAGITTLVDTESALVGLSKVMNESSADLDAFKARALEAGTSISQDFGQPLEQVLETMTLFGQQGRNLTETIALSKAAALAASVTTLDQPEAASALTAATEQFGLPFQDATSIIDKFNEVANNAAVTEDDLAAALKKSGQAAKNAGVDLDQFNGIVAAIAEQTRQSGNEIGTALRFIFSRLQTPEAESGLRQIGINARDAEGNIRSFVPIIEELAGKFDNLSNSQKTQVAISIAGTRRFNTLLALLDNFGRFQESAANSVNSAGSAFREQSQVVETAAFKIQQLVNSLKELALSFGSSLLEPLKGVVSVLGTLTNVLSAIPGFLKTTAIAATIGGLAFVKFSDHISDFLGLAGSVQGAAGVIGGALGQGLTKGVSAKDQLERAGGLASATLSPGLVAARTAADFSFGLRKSKVAAEGFAATLGKSNQVLVGMQGQALKNVNVFGKLGATIRGFGTKSFSEMASGASASALAIGGLNSGLSRFVAFLGLIARNILKLTIVGPALFKGLDVLAQQVGQSSLGAGKAIAGLGTALRFVGASAVIFGLVKGFQFLSAEANKSAKSIQESLQPEIQKRREAIALLKQQEQQVQTLASARRKAATLASSGPGSFDALSPTQNQESLSGRFKSPEVAIRNLRQQEQDTINNLGFSDPTVIDSIDKFGNVVLDGALALDTLAASASRAQETILGLRQVDVIKGFSDELKPETGILKDVTGFIRNQVLAPVGIEGLIDKDAFKSEIEKVDAFRATLEKKLNNPLVAQAKKLGVSVSTLDADFGKELQKAASDFQEASLLIREVQSTIDSQIKALTPDADPIVFEKLARDAKTAFDRQVNESLGQGIETNVTQILQRAKVINTSTAKQIRESLDVNNELTIGNLREAGQAPDILSGAQVRSTKEQLDKATASFSGGEFVLFRDAEAKIDRQAIVKVTSAGKRVIEVIKDELGRTQTQELSDAFSKSVGDIFVLDTDKIRRQFVISLQEVQREIAGAGRGNIITADLNLGANFRSDLSGQQRAAQGDETLFTDLITKQKELTDFIASRTGDAKPDEQINQLADPGTITTIRNLANEIDNLATSARIAAEIEKVGAAFEEATRRIKASRIDDVIAAQFSGGVGKTQAGIKQDFTVQSVSEFASQRAPSAREDAFSTLANSLSRTNKATGEYIGGLRKAEENVKTFLSDFQAARVGGGSSDPARLTDLARRAAALTKTGISEADATLVALNSDQLKAQEVTNELLTQIATSFVDDPQLQGAAFAQQALSNRNNPEALGRIASQIQSNPEVVTKFSAADLQTLASLLPKNESPAVLQAALVSGAKAAAGSLASELLSGGGLSTPDGADKSSLKDRAQQASDRAVAANRRSRAESQLQGAFISFASSPEFQKSITSGSGQDVQIDTGKLDEILSIFARDAGDRRSGSDANDIAKKINEALSTGEGLQSLRNTVSEFLLSSGKLSAPQAQQTEQVLGRTAEDAATKMLAFNAALEKSALLNDKLSAPIRETLTSLLVFQKGIESVTASLTTGLQKTIDELSVSRSLSTFSAPQTGPLAGVTVPQTQLDIRSKNIAELSGKELTSVESPNLARGLSEADTAFKGLVAQLGAVKQAELDVQRALASREASGDVKGVQIAKEALVQLGGVSTLVEGQINNAQGTLKKFGESFRGLEVINQLRVDIEKFVQAFDKELQLSFDPTSIKTALGQTPFSATRPTFEQFSQGQGGNLTKFERALADIDAKVSSGELTPQQASRGRSQAEFQRNEEIIALAQSRETEKLQAQVRTAEQVRSRLFDFTQTGAPGSEEAKSLIAQLTNELTQAGDIIQGGGSAQTIRDPRTGREVNVPASEVNAFRGVSGLDSITQKLAAISQEAAASQDRDRASLITDPLLKVLDQLPTKLDEIKDALADSTGIDSPEQAVQDLDAINKAMTELPNIIKALNTGIALTGNQIEQFNTAVTRLSDGLSPEALKGLLDTVVVASTDGVTSTLKEAIESVASNSSFSSETDRANVQNVANKATGDTQDEFKDITTDAIRTLNELSTASGSAQTSLSGDSGLAASANKAREALSTMSAEILDLVGKLKNVSIFGGTTVPQKRALGGLITGPGGPTSDKVPLLASPGEFVINAKAAGKLGLANLNALNGSASVLGPNAEALTQTPGQALAHGGVVFKARPAPPHFTEAEKKRWDRYEQLEVEASQRRVDKANAEHALMTKENTESANKQREGLKGSSLIDLLKRRKELQLKERDLLSAKPPKKTEAEQVRKDLGGVDVLINEAQKVREKERRRLADLEAQQKVKQKAIAAGAQSGTGSGFTVSDEALTNKTAAQLRLDETARIDALAERKNVFHGEYGRKGKNFARVNEEGRFVFESDASNGGIPVSQLRGVSTKDPVEFKAEVDRRKAFQEKLKTADADREKEKAALVQEYATLKQKQIDEAEFVTNEDSLAKTGGRFRSFLADKTTTELQNKIKLYQRAQAQVTNYQNLLAGGTLNRDDGNVAAEELEQILTQIESFQESVSSSSIKALKYSNGDTGLRYRASEGSLLSTDIGGNPQAFGQVYLSNPQVDEQLNALTKSGTDAQLKSTIAALRKGRAFSFISQEIAKNSVLAKAENFLGDAEFAVKQSFGQDSLLGAGFGTLRSTTKAVNTIAGGVAGIGGALTIDAEQTRQAAIDLGARGFQGVEDFGKDVSRRGFLNASNDVLDPLGNAFGKYVVETGSLLAGGDSPEIAAEKRRIAALTSEADRNLAYRTLQQKQSDRRAKRIETGVDIATTIASAGGFGLAKKGLNATTGLARTGIGKVEIGRSLLGKADDAASFVTNRLPRNFSFTKSGRAANRANSLKSVSEVDDALRKAQEFADIPSAGRAQPRFGGRGDADVSALLSRRRVLERLDAIENNKVNDLLRSKAARSSTGEGGLQQRLLSQVTEDVAVPRARFGDSPLAATRQFLGDAAGGVKNIGGRAQVFSVAAKKALLEEVQTAKVAGRSAIDKVRGNRVPGVQAGKKLTRAEKKAAKEAVKDGTEKFQLNPAGTDLSTPLDVKGRKLSRAQKKEVAKFEGARKAARDGLPSAAVEAATTKGTGRSLTGRAVEAGAAFLGTGLIGGQLGLPVLLNQVLGGLAAANSFGITPGLLLKGARGLVGGAKSTLIGGGQLIKQGVGGVKNFASRLLGQGKQTTSLELLEGRGLARQGSDGIPGGGASGAPTINPALQLPENAASRVAADRAALQIGEPGDLFPPLNLPIGPRFQSTGPAGSIGSFVKPEGFITELGPLTPRGAEAAAIRSRGIPKNVPRADLEALALEGAPDVLDTFISQARREEPLRKAAEQARQAAEVAKKAQERERLLSSLANPNDPFAATGNVSLAEAGQGVNKFADKAIRDKLLRDRRFKPSGQKEPLLAIADRAESRAARKAQLEADAAPNAPLETGKGNFTLAEEDNIAAQRALPRPIPTNEELRAAARAAEADAVPRPVLQDVTSAFTGQGEVDAIFGKGAFDKFNQRGGLRPETLSDLRAGKLTPDDIDILQEQLQLVELERLTGNTSDFIALRQLKSDIIPANINTSGPVPLVNHNFTKNADGTLAVTATPAKKNTISGTADTLLANSSIGAKTAPARPRGLPVQGGRRAGDLPLAKKNAALSPAQIQRQALEARQAAERAIFQAEFDKPNVGSGTPSQIFGDVNGPIVPQTVLGLPTPVIPKTVLGLPTPKFEVPSTLGRLKNRLLGKDGSSAAREAVDARAAAVRAEEATKIRPAGEGSRRFQNKSRTAEQLAVDTYDDLKALRIAAASVTDPRAIVELNAELARAQIAANLQKVKGSGFERLAPGDEGVAKLLPTFVSERLTSTFGKDAVTATQAASVRGVATGFADGQGARRVILFSKALEDSAGGNLVQLAKQAELTATHEFSHLLGNDEAFFGGGATLATGGDIVIPAVRENPLAKARGVVPDEFKGRLDSLSPVDREAALQGRHDVLVNQLTGGGENAQFLGSKQSLADIQRSRLDRELESGKSFDSDLLTTDNLRNINADTNRRFQQYLATKGTEGMSAVEAKAFVQTKIEPLAYADSSLQTLRQNAAYRKFNVELDKGITAGDLDLPGNKQFLDAVPIPDILFPKEALPNINAVKSAVSTGKTPPPIPEAALRTKTPPAFEVPPPPQGLLDPTFTSPRPQSDLELLRERRRADKDIVTRREENRAKHARIREERRAQRAIEDEESLRFFAERQVDRQDLFAGKKIEGTDDLSKRRREARIQAEIEKRRAEIEAKKFALGGKITGPGGPTSDRVPIMASAGEFVLNANSVGRLGLPVVESMNRTGILPKFQHGGRVGDNELASAQQELYGGPRLLSRTEAYGAADAGSIVRSSLPTDPGVLSARKDFEQAKQRLTDAEALAERRAANTRLSVGAAEGLVSQREANARFSTQAKTALLKEQGRTSFSVGPDVVVPQNLFDRGTAKRLQDQVDAQQLDGFGSGGYIKKDMHSYADGGGPIVGSGGPREDNILAKLSSGEFVINANSASKIGLPVLEELNATGRLPGFKDGGDVSGRSGGVSVNVNTDEIAAAISQAIVSASAEASIVIDTGDVASVISNAVATALSSIKFPDVKLDASSLSGADLGNSLGAGIKDKLTLVEGRIEGVRQDVAEIGVLKEAMVLQEQRIMDKISHRFSTENNNANVASTDSVLGVDKEVKVIRTELIRLENMVRAATSQASLALSKAQIK